MSGPVTRALGRLIPARWRTSVLHDLEDERRAHGWNSLQEAWHALRIAATLHAQHRPHPLRRIRTTGRHLMDSFRRDVGFAIRLAVRAPLFTLLAIVTLGLGVGANAAVFSVAKAVLLDPLPYADDDRLIRVYGRPVLGPAERTPLSAGAIEDLATRQTTLQRLGVFYPETWERTYLAPDGAQPVTGGMIAPGFLETLGVTPAIGRTFREDESPRSGAYPTLLSHEMWRRDFGGDAGVIGDTVQVDTDAWEIVGVLPDGFTGPMGSADLWFPLDLTSTLEDPGRARTSEWLGLVARLAPAATLDDASSEVAAVARALAHDHPATDGHRSMVAVALRDAMAGDTRTPLLVLMGSAVLVLLIACANLAGALLSRTIGRRAELAVRIALGAGRGRLIRQLLTESVLLASGGLLLGVALATSALRALQSLDIPALPRYAALSLDPGTVAFAALLALSTGLAMGLFPALSAHRANPQHQLRESTRSLSEGRGPGRLRGVLLSAQIALSLWLLFGAGLLTRSLAAMAQEPLGFTSDSVLTLSVKGPMPRPDAVRKQFFDDFESRLRALPGVVAAAHANALPGPAMTANRADLAIEGAAPAGADPTAAVPVVSVSDDWFRTLNIPLHQGRSFGPEDDLDAAPVVIVSEALARSRWPDGNPLGARVRLGDDASAPWATVVGIAGDVRTDPARLTPEPLVYTAGRQSLMRESRLYAVRTASSPAGLTDMVRAELRALDPTVPMSDVATLAARLDARLNVHRLPALLMATFAGLAVVLAAVGIYALVGNVMASRERELSLRIALGSRPAEVAWVVVRFGGLWTSLGLAAGVAGIGAIGYAMRDLLYAISPLDPVAMGLALTAVGLSGVVALVAPIRRALRLDPAAVLH